MMVKRRISGDFGFPRPTRPVFVALCLLAVVSCVAPPNSGALSFAAPPMRWDHRPEATQWTASTLGAIAAKDAVLSGRVPADIAAWCPAYPTADVTARRAFWAGLLSAVAKYESSWNPGASGGGGRWIGLMQISPRTAASHGCAATSTQALKNGAANLQCAVQIMSRQVGKDGVVAGSGNRGIGRDWMPLRNGQKRAEIAAWTRSQPYCVAQAGKS